MIEPNNLDYGEVFSGYIELANYGEDTVELQGLSLVSNTGSETISSSLVIAPGGFILMGISDNTILTLGVELDYAWGFGSQIGDLNNTDGNILLYNDNGDLIDEVSYESETCI